MGPISFTYLPMGSMWVVTLHSLFLYSEPPLPCHPPSYWLRLFPSQTFCRINTRTFLKSGHTSYLPAYEGSETSAYKIQTPENYPEERIQHSEHDESWNEEYVHLLVIHSVYWISCCLYADHILLKLPAQHKRLHKPLSKAGMLLINSWNFVTNCC